MAIAKGPTELKQKRAKSCKKDADRWWAMGKAAEAKGNKKMST